MLKKIILKEVDTIENEAADCWSDLFVIFDLERKKPHSLKGINLFAHFLKRN